ncbi:MAG: hypothetical protein DRJ01_17385 [Bacteroidetes bacterium]|nr:MAG: hypothetical protein DRJ01_17385 [Bacteroidota bacterium]
MELTVTKPDKISYRGTIKVRFKLEKTDSLQYINALNYPNPFNPENKSKKSKTTIMYFIPQNSIVSINIYNNMGQSVMKLLNKYQTKGEHYIEWDGKDNLGKSVASGTYIYVIKAGNLVTTKKIMILK